MSTRFGWIAGLGGLIVLAGCGKTAQSLIPNEAMAVITTAGTVAADQRRDGRTADGAEEAAAQPISGPTTITSPGNYRLTEDIEVAQGDGITITASHVRLWLGDHRLTGPGNKAGRAIVIEGAQDVTVAGGHIKRFGIGAVLVDASRCRLGSLEIQGGDETADPGAGNPPQIGIMLINSAMNTLADNDLRRLNLGIFVRGGGSHGNRLAGNRAIGGDHGLLGICYNPAPGGDPAGPHDDQVSRNLLARFGTGIAASAQSAENVFRLNTIRYFLSAYEDQNGTNVFANNRTEQIAP